MNTPFENPAHTPVSTFPIISFECALRKVKHGNQYRTLGKRNANNEIDVFLCLTNGTPLAIVDFGESWAEVRHG